LKGRAALPVFHFVMRAPPIVRIGRFFFAVGMVAFGIQFFILARDVDKLAPAWPAWLPGQPWAYAAGSILIAGGVSIILGARARLAAILLGTIILLWDLFRDVDLIKVAATSLDIVKALALGGGAFVIAGTFPREARHSGGRLSSLLKPMEKLIPLGRFLLAPQMIVAGTEHFIYVRFVVDLVPAWIPGHLFWTYFSGTALIAGGIGLIVKRTARLAAGLLGATIFIWVLVLHVPRAIADLHSANEWTSVFQALAMSGIAFILATTPPRDSPAG
jgi:uncharacterized membrane protein